MHGKLLNTVKLSNTVIAKISDHAFSIYIEVTKHTRKKASDFALHTNIY